MCDGRLRITLLIAVLAPFVLTACVYATAGVQTFDRSPAPALQGDDTRLSATEIAYARDTARIVFNRRDGERTTSFVFADARDGYGLCLRAGAQYALLVFQRRVFEAAISQAADDAAILRSAADIAICTSATNWTDV